MERNMGPTATAKPGFGEVIAHSMEGAVAGLRGSLADHVREHDLKRGGRDSRRGPSKRGANGQARPRHVDCSIHLKRFGDQRRQAEDTYLDGYRGTGMPRMSLDEGREGLPSHEKTPEARDLAALPVEIKEAR